MDNGKTRTILQIIVACYVIYLAYGLREGILSSIGGRKIALIVAAVVMVALSVAIIIRGIRILLKKEDEKENSEKETEDDKSK